MIFFLSVYFLKTYWPSFTRLPHFKSSLPIGMSLDSSTFVSSISDPSKTSSGSAQNPRTKSSLIIVFPSTGSNVSYPNSTSLTPSINPINFPNPSFSLSSSALEDGGEIAESR